MHAQMNCELFILVVDPCTHVFMHTHTLSMHTHTVESHAHTLNSHAHTLYDAHTHAHMQGTYLIHL